ncbi:MAG: preprotein translocase subunit SecA [Prevotellaceae bacterium]|jgi:preprotein translocase subunit SecA|nr:preprotein translocase subunit SecA [Prevotellaceae bacterium]
MTGIGSIIKKIFGSKAERDWKSTQPYVEKIKQIYPEIEKLSNDELRARTKALQQKIQDNIKEISFDIIALEIEIEYQDDVKIKEKNYEKIDKLKKEVNERIETVLLEILPEAFAIVKDTARRFKENEEIEVTATEFDKNLSATREQIRIEGDKAYWATSWIAGGNMQRWDMVHYDVQLFGGVVLHLGKIAEMATGEGKTLVATLPVFLNALAGKGVHVVTVNDYLAKRDSEWMGPIYEFHGLSVDCIDKHQPNSEARQIAYLADITFGTNNEFGFDYLRDNMAIDIKDLSQYNNELSEKRWADKHANEEPKIDEILESCFEKYSKTAKFPIDDELKKTFIKRMGLMDLRGHHYAIVDEVDSVLIDDARTPLIISGPVPRGDDQLFDEYKPLVEQLYNFQRNYVTQILGEARKFIATGNDIEGGKLLLRAHKGLPKYKPLIKFLSEQGMKALLQKTENTYMQDNNRQMHIITDELFFVIEEKNNTVELTDKGIDIISKKVEDTKFFVLPDIGNELAELEKKELSTKEKLEAKENLLTDYAIKSERVHTIHQLLKAYAMFEKDVEYVVMDNKVKIVDEQTGRILEGRRYSDGLHQAIEAKERVKVEDATQTFATITLQNYFRMYHKLAGMTGTAETEAGEFWSIYKLDVVVIPTNKPVIRIDHNDFVYKTKREKYNAVLNEIAHLSKDLKRPVLVGTTSVEVSELLSKMLKLRGIKHNVLNAKQHQREADIVAEAGQAGAVTIATNMAGRGTDIKLGAGVREAGGLAIIGTERHESRRVDRQLRGRSGRQGDPGTSQFYVSLEDNLMRLFGSERIAKIMDTLGLKDGEVIQHSMISKSIGRAQRKVEENNFGIRKRLLEYDDVMNSQREVIYRRRRNALYGDRVEVDIRNMMSDYAGTLIDKNAGTLDYEEMTFEIVRNLSIEPGFTQEEFETGNNAELADKLLENITISYENRMKTIAEKIYPVVKNVYENQGSTYENILIPISDGQRIYQVSVNLKKACETQGAEFTKVITKTIALITIDEYWKEHLLKMDELKQSVQNATYEQKDPLLIYKFESFNLFETMLTKTCKDVTAFLMRAAIPLRDKNVAVRREEQRKRTDMSSLKTGRENLATNSSEQKTNMPVRVEKKVGRNELCPCGSGKKYKNCHGKTA